MTVSKSTWTGMALGLALLGGCGNESPTGDADQPHRVATSGKEATALAALPAEVLAAALAARPELQVTAAEHEVRDGEDYYDVAGVLADGSEIELDMTRVNGAWAVVEFQRDIDLEVAPAPVRMALGEDDPDWQPARVIESDQGNGIVIYEFFGSDASGKDIKIEVKWQDGKAEVLRDEWQH